MGADVLGNIIHKVLEELYKPFVGTTPDFNEIERKLENVLGEIISIEMKNRWIKTGINKMNIQIIKTLLLRFIEVDRKFIENKLKDGRSYKIIKLEEGLMRSIEFYINDEKIVLNLQWKLVRIYFLL